jgi:hypothetical protein
VFVAALSFIGLIHGVKVEWNANGQVALGYLFAGLVFLAFAFVKPTVAGAAADRGAAEPALLTTSDVDPLNRNAKEADEPVA